MPPFTRQQKTHALFYRAALRLLLDQKLACNSYSGGCNSLAGAQRSLALKQIKSNDGKRRKVSNFLGLPRHQGVEDATVQRALLAH